MRDPVARSSLEQVPHPASLRAELEAAEDNYRSWLTRLKTDSSDAARWQCARALIEFDRLSRELKSTAE